MSVVLVFEKNLRPCHRNLGRGGEAEEAGGQTDGGMGELWWFTVLLWGPGEDSQSWASFVK